jgi:hypothetical protein
MMRQIIPGGIFLFLAAAVALAVILGGSAARLEGGAEFQIDPEAAGWIPWFDGGAPPAEMTPAPIVRAVPVGPQVSAWYRGENVGPRTCASRVFPRGTWLILEAGGRRLPVRVNDYGPADPATGTLLDVSADVAADLGFKAAGHGVVMVYRVVVAP